MIKYLVVIGVIAFIYFFFIKKKPLNNTPKKQTKQEDIQSNDMVECSSCGIYFELSDGIVSSSKYFCSNECVKKGST